MARFSKESKVVFNNHPAVKGNGVVEIVYAEGKTTSYAVRAKANGQLYICEDKDLQSPEDATPPLGVPILPPVEPAMSEDERQHLQGQLLAQLVAAPPTRGLDIVMALTDGALRKLTGGEAAAAVPA